MSRSSFSKAYEEIAKLEPMEMTFTIEDAEQRKDMVVAWMPLPEPYQKGKQE